MTVVLPLQPDQGQRSLDPLPIRPSRLPRSSSATSFHLPTSHSPGKHLHPLPPPRPDSGASTSSVRTSNSSHHKPESLSQEQTAQLINRLYARLDVQGVDGDGYDEGRERSRDGIISHQEAEGFATMKRTSSRILGPSSTLPVPREPMRVDRYGFFASSHPAALGAQHHRLATLASASFQTLLTTSPKASVSPATARINSNSPEAELRRIEKWATMLSPLTRDPGGNVIDWTLSRDFGAEGSSGWKTFRRRAFKGVPDRWRRAVWGWEMERMASLQDGKRKGKESVESLEREYQLFLARPSSQDVQIDLDVPRTISGHVQFHTRYGQGQRALFHVLHAFAIRTEPQGGYCQGMGVIAGTLLCYFEPERAYASLVHLFTAYSLSHVFAPSFPGLLALFHIHQRLLAHYLPSLWTIFQEHGVSTSAYATKWFITLFGNSVPFSTQLRLWDTFLLEGMEVLSLMGLAIVWSFRGEFAAANASFESILSRLSSYFLVEDEDALLRWIRKALYKSNVRSLMQEWRGEWDGWVREGTTEGRVT